MLSKLSRSLRVYPVERHILNSGFFASGCAVPNLAAFITTWNDQGLNSADTQKVTLAASIPTTANRLYYRLDANSTNYYYGPTTNTSYQFTSINDEQTVNGYVRSYDEEDGYSAWTGPKSATIPDRTAPNAPTINLTSTGDGANSGYGHIDLTWSATDNGAAGVL